MFNIWTLVSLYREAASFITSKILEHNTENEEFEKSKVMQKCLLTHVIVIIIIKTLLMNVVGKFVSFHRIEA